MLKVYVIVDDCPTEFGEKSLVRVYINREDARYFVRRKKTADAYKHQYYTIVPMNVKTNTKGD